MGHAVLRIAVDSFRSDLPIPDKGRYLATVRRWDPPLYIIFSSIESDQDVWRGRIDRIKLVVTSAQEALAEQLNVQEERLDAKLAQKLNAVVQRLDAQDAKPDVQDAKLDALAQRLEQKLEEKLEQKLDAKFDALAQTLLAKLDARDP